MKALGNVLIYKKIRQNEELLNLLTQLVKLAAATLILGIIDYYL